MSVMWTLIIKNNSAVTPRNIEDLGITVPVSSQLTFSNQFGYEDIASSDDLREFVNNGELIVNNGTSDLGTSDGVEYLTLYNIDRAKEDFYTKPELQSSGQAAVHWQNITDKPSFGVSTWLDPVLAKVLTIDSAAPSGSDGDFYVDSDDNHLYKYITDTWVDQGAPSTSDRVIVLDSTAQMIFEYGGSSWDTQDDNADNDAVLVDDDGDGRQSQYVYDTTTLSWIKMADVDFGEPRNLDEAYDDEGSGLGRTINTDAGAVKLDTGVATNAPLELTSKSSLATTGLASGQLGVKDGELYVYDGTRSKWLSISSQYLVFGRKGNTQAQYLPFYGGDLPSNNSGLRIPRDACIIAMSGQLDSAGTVDFRLRSNDNTSPIATLSLAAVAGAHDTTLNVNTSAGDFLQLFSDNASAVTDPMVIVEIKYRG